MMDWSPDLFLRRAAVCLLLLLFSAAPASAAPPVRLLYTDWTSVPGGVFYMGESREATLLRAGSGRLYDVAVGPDGAVYVSDANTPDLLRWNGVDFDVVHRHTTYLRDVALDAAGRIYFSESSGATTDGRIYRLEAGGPTLYYTVKLAEVDGFWAGNFAFAPDDTLYLSTGNRRGASLYRVEAGSPVAFYTDPDGSIAGFDFDPTGNIYYADWFDRIHLVSAAGAPISETRIAGRRLSDVHVLTRSIALGPEAGRVNAVAIDPTDPENLYAATPSGGIFRSTDGGEHWFLRSRGISDPHTDGVLVHPWRPNEVFAVTPSGIFRSRDRGLNWTRVLGLTPPLPPESMPSALRSARKNPIRFDPKDGAIYAAPFCAGLYRSTDGGSWGRPYPSGPAPPEDRCVTSIDVSAADGGTVYITTPSGIRRRVAGSTAWTSLGSEIDDADPVVLRVAPSHPDRLYVAATNLDGWPLNTNVWVRENAGGPFVRTTHTPPWPDWLTAMSLDVDPNDPLHVFFGTPALWTTTDAASWTNVVCSSSKVCGVDYRGVQYDAAGSELFAPHDQGIFRLDLATDTFTPIERGLVNTQFYDIDTGVLGTVYGGTQDTGALRREGAAWEEFSTAGSGDVLDLLAHPTAPRRIFIRTNAEMVLRSSDGGRSVTPSGWVPGQGFWNHQLAYHAPSTTLYAGTRFEGVYKSVDDGVSFVPANVNIERKAIRCLALKPGSADTLYAGTLSDGVYKTEDGGTWSQLTSFPESAALVFAFHPSGTRVYAGTPSGILVSSDGGSWSPSNTGLPPVRVVSELVVDPVCPCLLYAGLGYYDSGTQYGGGVYQSSDGGASWRELSSSDGAWWSVPAITIDPTERSRLYVATYGSGVRLLLRDITPAGGCGC